MSSLFKLFANPTLVETLSLFLLNPEEEFYQSLLVRKTGKALMQVQRALKTLKEVGLIASEHQGRMVYYKAVKTHPIFQDLKKMFLKTVSLGEGIRRALLPIQNKISIAFIFGSVAKDTESLDSDIDLFIVGDLTLRELIKSLSPFSKGLQRELNPVIFETLEFKKRVLEKDHFLVEVIGSPKLWILGNENDLKRLVKGRKTKGS
ncbi:MAG: nucleotidyltransferase domain-containing protein [Simkania sp.]|nr:nucleotidyltransferase domain-containing protein [Simkania sp.]